MGQLNKLPTEMRVALLAAMPDLDTLRNLTLAVPGYFSAYIGGRKEILQQVLLRSLSPELLIEAYTLQAAVQLELGRKSREDIKSLLNVYHFDGTLKPSLANADEETLCSMTTTHLRMQRFVSEMSSHAVSSRPNVLGHTHELLRDSTPLSLVESARFMRAFYRFDIYCQLFGPRHLTRPLVENFIRLPTPTNQPSELLATYEYWELTELDCVRHHLQQHYYRLLQRHSTRLGVKFGKSKFAACDRVITAIPPAFREFLFGYEGAWYQAAADHCASYGLPLFAKILDAESPFEEAELLAREAFPPTTVLLGLMRTLSRESAQRAHNRRESVYRSVEEFWNDNLNFADTPSAPNPGFLWARDPSRVVRYYREELPNEEWLFSWAYAMWDRERLDKWGILRSNHESFRPFIKEFQEAKNNV